MWGVLDSSISGLRRLSNGFVSVLPMEREISPRLFLQAIFSGNGSYSIRCLVIHRIKVNFSNRFSGMPTGCRKRACIWESRALIALKSKLGMPFTGKTWGGAPPSIRCRAYAPKPTLCSGASHRTTLLREPPLKLRSGIRLLKSRNCLRFGPASEGRRQVHNHQAPVEQVRPLGELAQLIIYSRQSAHGDFRRLKRVVRAR